MGSENLQNVVSEKILGITINENMSCAEHLKKTTATVNIKVALLVKIKSFYLYLLECFSIMTTFCLIWTIVQSSGVFLLVLGHIKNDDGGGQRGHQERL